MNHSAIVGAKSPVKLTGHLSEEHFRHGTGFSLVGVLKSNLPNASSVKQFRINKIGSMK
jgi:hypothetical protein